ncbi:hypothetical protein NVS55_10985 [Myxococcus stipitatus]|uniref:hypothetical protein n=1 Tax=Myxococcus stipitatus TaxID=83455 RepID=UPI00314511D2
MSTDFKLRLAETIAWCGPRVVASQAGVTTRTEALMPPLCRHDGDTQLRLLLDPPGAGKEAVEFIGGRRREQLLRANQGVHAYEGLAGGRVYATDFNTDICGAATAPSNGFLDDYDIPGWDTWFAHEQTGPYGGIVYGWVPPVLIELADEGFYVIPVQCIWWVDDADLRLLLG